ncbi:hypothetical protein PIB30_094011 [Stylosanthes scabra]|uniref:Uncharacterized protein n=1 Tax=Stylosanthes scabra TaxID=79078 RepID=A0ABU6UWH6_9FABA|nr:hypothetical protein [Stylosanthes scabra]
MNGGPGTSSKISHVSSQSVASGVEELTKPNATAMKIDEVVKLGEECMLWIAGSIVALKNGILTLSHLKWLKP